MIGQQKDTSSIACNPCPLRRLVIAAAHLVQIASKVDYNATASEISYEPQWNLSPIRFH